jgi:hypothetical protein
MVWTAYGTDARDFGNGLDIYFSRSTDYGATWSPARIVNDDPYGMDRHQFYPSISVNSVGTIAVTWYDQRDDADHLATQYYMAYSINHGESFGENFPVSTETTDFGTIGERNGGFGIGEYTQVLTTMGYAIPVWSDGRNENGNLDIYAAFVPLVNDPNNISSVRRIERVTAGVRLLDPVPNPVATSDASVGVQLDQAGQVRLTLIDLKGATVATIVDRRLEPGDYRFPVPTSTLAAGSYYIRLESSDGSGTRPLTVVR